MAFSDNSPGANASSSKSSRFSSLKVFGKFSKEKDSLKPPPPPPKDPFYLNNRSLVSLHNTNESMPATPVTPHSIGTAYATSNTVLGSSQSQYVPTSSSASLVSSPSDAGAPSLPPLPKQPSQKKSGFFKFRRVTKSPSLRSASVDDEMSSLQSNREDENISTPYNFQHNIHVDDGLAGMPPSWTVSLAKAGFTEEEIAAIYARKQAGTLTPGNDFGSPYYSSYGSDRPKSPAAISIASSAAASSLQRPGTSTSSHGSAGGVSPILTHPVPRSTSLPRQYSDNSLRQTIVAGRNFSPSQSPNLGQQQQHVMRTERSRNNSASSVALSVSIPISESSRLRPNAVAVQGNSDDEASGAEYRQNQSSSNPSRQPSRNPSIKSRTDSPRMQPYVPTGLVNIASQGPQQGSPGSRPSTPPRRTYFVANSQTPPQMQSPPPSYSAVNGIHQQSMQMGSNGYPVEKSETEKDTPKQRVAAAGRQHHTQGSTDSTRSRSSSHSQSSPSLVTRSQPESSSKRPPFKHQYSISSASQQSRGSSNGSDYSPKRSMSTSTTTSRSSKRRSKRNFNNNELNLSLNLDLGLDSWTESLFSSMPSGSPTKPMFSSKENEDSSSERSKPTSTLPSSSSLSSSPPTRSGLGGGNSFLSSSTSRDTIKPPPKTEEPYRSVLDHPRPKPPAPVLGIPPRVHVIAEDSSPLSTASPSTTSFTTSPAASPSPAASTFVTNADPPSPHQPLWTFAGSGESHGMLGVEQDDRQTFPVSPNMMSEYAPSIASPSPRAGLFDEIAGMVGIQLEDEYDDENEGKLSPESARGRGQGQGRTMAQRNQSPALSETHSPTIPISPGFGHLNGDGRVFGNGKINATSRTGNMGNRISAYRIQDRDKMRSALEADAEGYENGWREEKGQLGEEEDDNMLTTGGKSKSNRNSSRSSTSTVTTLTVRNTPAGVKTTAPGKVDTVDAVDAKSDGPAERPSTVRVSNSSAAQRTESPRPPPPLPLPQPPPVLSPTKSEFPLTRSKSPAASLKHPASPQSSTFGSEEGSAGLSSDVSSRLSGSSVSQLSPTTETDNEDEDELVYYLESPGPGQTDFNRGVQDYRHLLTSTTDTFGGVYKEDKHIESQVSQDDDDDDDDYDPDDDVLSSGHTISHGNVIPPPRPTIVISNAPVQSGPITAAMQSAITPITPAQRYPGWLSEVVKPLEEFIDEPIDPREYYSDLQEIAEGESGSVSVAKITETGNIHKLKLPPLLKAQDADNQMRGVTNLVAIKCVAIMPSGSTKLDDLRRELVLLRGVSHPNILSMDVLYVDLVEDSLWVRMELMERSLADVIELIDGGLMLQERMIARFTSDIVEALTFLRSHNIAHRDVRSDNLLLNQHGFLKLTDFSNAIKLPRERPMAFDPVGVFYWQAPEIRIGPYNALKIDVWSMGATVWEMAQARPPFADSEGVSPADRWPALDKPQLYSPAFHDFLRLCSEPYHSRPDPDQLTKNPFVKNSCGRPVIIQLLQQCTAIEQAIQQREDNS
ncbi:ste ste20 paka protein kinase [Moniliophthora roreri MCA 2997]|uniref:Ste ste20 paka protein kinase n=1 Tax=Moniliophthora roreri (strain MCA 2997) TaxID=1381753 RepID=V2XV38_MONRO|nr:ste ste20 paka protein kinase [Moniliophthora roreri MCA 2997]